jgi:predicted PurR-regulated permease PerM
VIGLFVGPVLLAVSYTLIGEWIDLDPALQPVKAATPEVPSPPVA